jgi:hypothetical protein
MKQELDEKLCKTYPEIFAGRNKSMMETCMCWGFSHGDGWYNIIDNLCSNIQHHINWTNKQADRNEKINQACVLAKMGDWTKFHEHYSVECQHKDEVIKQINNGTWKRHKVERIPEVTAVQVKEKFGTLRFYYDGGDDYIRGLVSMAESMSAVTCEECGNLGKSRRGGWIRTLCDSHSKNEGYDDNAEAY